MLKKTILIVMCCICLSAAEHVVQAQSLWATINQNEVQVKLSERPDKLSIAFDKVGKSVVTADGKTLTFNPQGDKSYLTATLPPNTNLVGVSNDGGVIKSNEPDGSEYHLHYYAKAARTLKDAGDPVDTDAQWYARYGYGQKVAPLSNWGKESNNPDIPIFARLVKDGQPVAHAWVKIYDSKDTIRPDIKMTDASGSISFYVRGKNLYGLQAYWIDPSQKKHYSASLTFSIDAEVIQQRLSKTWVDDTEEYLSNSVSYVSDMSISQDSKRVITYGAITRNGAPFDQWDGDKWDKQLQVWNIKTGKEIWHHSALPYSTYSVFVKPDFKTMYVSNGGFDVLDIHSLRVIKHLNISNSSIRLSPDKKILAIGGANNVQFIDAKSQKIIRTYWHGGYGTQVFWGPDSKTLLMRAGWGKPQAINVTTAKQIHYPRWAYRVIDADAFAFSPSGKYLAKAKGQHIEIWTTPTENDPGQMLNAFAMRLDLVHVLQFSPDGKTLAVGGSSKTKVPVQFFSLTTVRK